MPKEVSSVPQASYCYLTMDGGRAVLSLKNPNQERKNSPGITVDTVHFWTITKQTRTVKTSSGVQFDVDEVVFSFQSEKDEVKLNMKESDYATVGLLSQISLLLHKIATGTLKEMSPLAQEKFNIVPYSYETKDKKLRAAITMKITDDPKFKIEASVKDLKEKKTYMFNAESGEYDILLGNIVPTVDKKGNVVTVNGKVVYDDSALVETVDILIKNIDAQLSNLLAARAEKVEKPAPGPAPIVTPPAGDDLPF